MDPEKFMLDIHEEIDSSVFFFAYEQETGKRNVTYALFHREGTHGYVKTASTIRGVVEKYREMPKQPYFFKRPWFHGCGDGVARDLNKFETRRCKSQLLEMLNA